MIAGALIRAAARHVGQGDGAKVIRALDLAEAAAGRAVAALEEARALREGNHLLLDLVLDALDEWPASVAALELEARVKGGS